MKSIDACHAVEQQATQTLAWVSGQNWLLDEALDHLTLGRAALLRARAGSFRIQHSAFRISPDR